MRILVTGGTGTVGEATVTELARRGHRVRLLSRHAREDAGAWPFGVEGVDGDVGDPAQIRGAADGCDAVLHMAAVVKERPPEVTFERVNVQGTRNVLAEATRAGVRRFVYVSSLGADTGESDYHRSKRQAETLVEGFEGNWTIARAGNVYGPGDEVVSLLLLWVRTLPAVPVIDDGDQPFQPVWSEDLAAALATCVEREDLAGRALDLTGEERTSMNDVVRRLGEVVGREPVHLPVPRLLAELGLKALKQLGVEPPVDEGQLTMLKEGSVLEPERNALVRELGVRPLPLAEGLRRLVDRQPEQLPQDGVGTLERKRFWADVEGTARTAEEAMRDLAARFDELTPWLMDLDAEPGAPRTVAEGVTLTMELPMRGRVQVRVIEATPTRITLVTLRGHMLAGYVQFEAEPRDGGFRFEVRTVDRASSALDWIALHPVGGRVQDANWTALVEHVVEACGGTAPEGVQHAHDKLEGDEAAAAERWIADAVRARHRRERQEAHAPEREQHEQRPPAN
jgi:NADH dehydrogenase